MARDDTARDSGTERTRSRSHSRLAGVATGDLSATAPGRPLSQVPAGTLQALTPGGDRRADAVAEARHGE